MNYKTLLKVLIVIGIIAVAMGLVSAEKALLEEGKYKVGKDLPAGEYTVKSTEDQGYIEVSSNSRHKVEDIVANDNFKTDKKVKLSNGQYITLSNGAEIDVDDSAKSSDSSSSGSSNSKSKEITVDGIKFNIPDGFKEDSAEFKAYQRNFEKENDKISMDGKSFDNGKDVFTLGTITYDDYEVDDSIAEKVGGKSMTVNGVDGYEYDYENQHGFVYAKDGKLVVLLANDEDLIDQIITK